MNDQERSQFGEKLQGYWPNTSTEPAAGGSSPVSAASRVDLPLPDGPSTAVMLPRGTSSDTSCRMVRPPRSRRRPDKRTAGVASADIEISGGGPETERDSFKGRG